MIGKLQKIYFEKKRSSNSFHNHSLVDINVIRINKGVQKMYFPEAFSFCFFKEKSLNFYADKWKTRKLLLKFMQRLEFILEDDSPVECEHGGKIFIEHFTRGVGLRCSQTLLSLLV